MDHEQKKFADPADRRAFTRMAKSLPVRYKLVKNADAPKEGPRAGEMSASTKDISAGGLAFYLKEKIAMHSLLEVRFQLPSETEPIICLAEIVRSRTVENTPYTDTAVHFLDVSSHDRQLIKKFIDKETKGHA